MNPFLLPFSWRGPRRARCGIVAGLLATALATAQRPDPTMQLMLSQPPVDVSSPVVCTAVVDPPVVPVGELAVYRITVNALEASVRWPPQMYVPPGLTMKAGGSGQILPLVGNVQRPTTARNFHLSATKPGFYTLPAFEIEAYGKRVVVPETQLEVASSRRSDYEPARRLHLQLATTNLFVGESVPVSVLAPGSISNVVSGLAQIQFNGEGVHGSRLPSRQLVETRVVEGRRVSTVVYESSITPIAAGPLELSVQGFTAGMFFTGPVVLQGQLSIHGFSTENVLLDSTPIQLNVQPLPSISDERGFTGYVGALRVDPPQLSTNSARVGDALKLLVSFSGSANVGRLIPPPPPRVAGWQIYPAVPADPPPRPPSTNVTVAFAYTLIPATEEASQTPAIPFHIFDPRKAAYVDLTIPPMPVRVSAEGLPTNWVSELSALTAGADGERRPHLGELNAVAGPALGRLLPLQSQPGAVLIQLGPVAGMLLWWGYARRQRFLAAHPEITRRRQARRALRRERRALRGAFARKDAAGFARRAVAAMQIVAAPHFPAEPRALVCGDVLEVFGPDEQHGRSKEVVRRFFAHTDASSFSTQPGESKTLFALRPELESILSQLEARL